MAAGMCTPPGDVSFLSDGYEPHTNRFLKFTNFSDCVCRCHMEGVPYGRSGLGPRTQLCKLLNSSNAIIYNQKQIGRF